ncbi:cation-translocating P-type ATPase [Oenococcus sp.]|uniref:cation-translocating P-type ATPase n=1 Tax=Oenococcus sp. TaxID=1979414 RepID=UPI0039EAF2C7
MDDEQLARTELDELYRKFSSSSQGLSTAQAASQLKLSGPNIISKARGESQLKAFFKSFSSMMAVLLWVSGVIAIFAGMSELGVAIWTVNVINGLFSFWQEFAAKKATDSLMKLLPTYAHVYRDGKLQQIDATQLVPGDIFSVQAGNSVSADARIIESDELEVDESALTGESLLVSKSSAFAKGAGKFAYSNLVYAGTTVASGSGLAIALATGMKTEFGQIARLTQSTKQVDSPLHLELNRLTRQLSIIAVSIGILFFLAAVFFVKNPIAKSFIFALGMIVAFIPEGLLPTVTLSLAQAVQRMARKNALVKNLNSVETLGETTVIATDKTGTLTQNQMTINHVWTKESEYEVTGEGYVKNGQIREKNKPIHLDRHPTLKQLITIASLDNDTEVQPAKSLKDRPKIIGTPTEASLVILAQKSGIDLATLKQTLPRIHELTFDSRRQRMSTIHQAGDGKRLILTKGALDFVLAVTDRILDHGVERAITDDDKTEILAANRRYAGDGLRSLAFAYRSFEDDSDPKTYHVSNCEQHLIFVGLAAMSDPPRPEIYEAIRKAHAAGIKIIMVTGDSELTAKSIATRIGLVSESARVVTGAELSKMTTDQLTDALAGEIIFARVAPEQKYQIVTALQSMGHIVASTGDGVNDAPALKKANIGVAMGVTGTDVAKDAADMILTDDNFASIVAAIEEGRVVYADIQKFLLYILNSNLPEAVPSVLFLLSGGTIPLSLTVMQILTVDLGTDMLPALGLGAEKIEAGVMDQPPRDRHAHLLTKNLLLKAFAWYGLWGSIISTAAYFFANWTFGWPGQALVSSGGDYRKATTMTLAGIVFFQIAAALNARTQRTSVFKIGVFSNYHIDFGILFEILLLLLLMYVPFLQNLFQTGPLNSNEWLLLVCIPVPMVLLEEARKALVRKYRHPS